MSGFGSTRRSCRRLARVAVAAAALTSSLILPTAAQASSVAIPFTDQYQKGSLTLCNRQGQAVTSGSLLTVPFVWTAVSSTPAPKGYLFAFLTVFQPIQYEDPSDWSGYQLTDVAAFQGTAHPTTQATDKDAPLIWAAQSYPPHWDNLMEIRMFFSSPGKSPYNTTYPAAVIQIDGNNWTLVSPPSKVPCSDGKAVAEEAAENPQSLTGPPPSVAIDPPGGPTAGGSKSGGSGSGRASTTTLAGQSSASQTSSGSGAKPIALSAPTPVGRSSGSSNTGTYAAIGVGAVLLIGLGAGLLRRRRTQSQS